jgi:hypothetical protein
MFPLTIDSNVIHLRDAFYRVLTNSSRFNEKIFSIFSEAYSVYLKTISEGNNISKDLPELEKIVKSRISNIFNLRLREEDFVSTLSDTVASYSTLAKSTGFGQAYQNSSIWWANWNNNFIEPVRDTFWRTPSHKIAEIAIPYYHLLVIVIATIRAPPTITINIVSVDLNFLSPKCIKR